MKAMAVSWKNTRALETKARFGLSSIYLKGIHHIKKEGYYGL
jgi:hypothetical protein